MGSHASWIRNAQIVILTVCVVVSGLNNFTSTARAADDTFNRNGSDDVAQDRQVFDGYDGGNKDTVKSVESVAPSLSPSYQSLLEQRLSENEKQIRELTGKLEQVSFENETLKKNIEKSQSDFDIRLNELKTKIDAQPATIVAPQAETPLTGTLSESDKNNAPADTNADANATPATNLDDAAPANSPTQKTLGTITTSPNGATISPDKNKDAASIYEDAYAALKAGNAGDAQTKFTNFLKQFPEHPLKANAVYWLGETYYAQANYAQSTRIFAESYKKFPKGPKAADSLLKMGMSLAQNKKTKEACVTFKQLKKEYATGQTSLINRTDAEMTKIACK